jgi:hypothetical protein
MNGDGLQIGVVNYAQKCHGLQIGLINIIRQDGFCPCSDRELVVLGIVDRYQHHQSKPAIDSLISSS